jgi:hydroxyacylglutathione hydrolase
MDAARTSTIGTERMRNPLFRAAEEATFRATMLAGLAPYPAYYAHMAPINRAGPAVLGALPAVAALDPGGVRDAIAAGAHVVDGRSRRTFAAGHLPRSLNVELTDSFASYVGWHVPFAAPLVLVLPEPSGEALAEATAQLVRIGYDRIDGWLLGGVDRWTADGGTLDTYTVATGRTIRDEVGSGATPRLLDVRDPGEWREAHVPGAIEIPHWELLQRLADVPRDGEVTVLCKSGSRASIAASLLDAAGYDVRLVAVGGAPELTSTR